MEEPEDRLRIHRRGVALTRQRLIIAFAATAAAALLAFFFWRGCRKPPTPPPRAKRIDIPKSRRAPTPTVPSAKIQKGDAATDRSKLRAWIERLGRAVVFHDQRTFAELKASLPALYESDLPWLFELLKEELFTASGAAELLRWYALPAAVPELEAMLRGPAHPAAKDVAVAALATIGGSAAQKALLDALATNPDGSIRARAAAALGRFSSAEAYQALVQAVHGDQDVNVRRAAAEALQDFPSKDLLEALLGMIPNERDPEIAASLAMAVYAAGGEEILPRLYEVLQSRPDAEASLDRRRKLRGDSRFAANLSDAFFHDGGTPVPLGAGMHRLGITVDPGSNSLEAAVRPLFRAAPLDRYAAFFYFRLESEFAEDLAAGVASARAYDAGGRPIPGGVPKSDRDGTVHLRFLSPGEFAPGVLGFTEGTESTVTPVSLLHEFGHAFAELADEYDLPQASDLSEANLDLPGREPKWNPLIRRGILGSPSPRGGRVIPSNRCYMNNHVGDDRWCPVCQLEILARLCDRTGAPVPW